MTSKLGLSQFLWQDATKMGLSPSASPNEPRFRRRNRKGDPMNRIVMPMLAFGLLVAFVPSGWAAEPNAEQAKAIAAIEKLGGNVTFDEKSPDKPVISVDLSTSKVTDAGLEHLKGLSHLRQLYLYDTQVTDAGLKHLRGLSQLQKLFLANTKVTDAGLEQLKRLSQLQTLDLMNTQVTDAGLRHLKGLSQLRELFLANTKVTDAGLEHLKGLSQLQTLDLNGTKVTDAGLEHLKGLSQLRELHLFGTKVTEAGVKDLQKTLPKARITR